MSLKSLKNQTLRNKSTINSVNLTGGASTGPVITSIIVTDSNYNNLDDTALLPAGGYAKLIGSGFASGCSAYFNGSSVTTTFVSATEVRVVIPATTAGTYNVMLFNPSTAGAIYLNLGISSAPTFTTTAGSLGTSYETTAVSTSIAATGDAPITYALYSGSLPTGVTLASNGTLSGTSPVEASSTTYSFVVQATDAQLQDTTRSFSLTISTDIVTWSTPAADFAYTLAGNEAMSNVSLSAASAAGYNITYAANTLPTGVSLSGNTIFGTPTVEQTVYTALTATAATTGRSATRYVSWSIALGDAYWKYNTLLIPGASTTFVDDASTNNFAVSIFGDTKPNSFNPYTPGYYSNYFDGSGDYLTVPANAIWSLAGDFTVEAWVYQTAAKDVTIAARWPYNGTESVIFRIQSNLKMSMAYNVGGGGANGPTSTGNVPLNTWNHVVWTRSGTTLRYFINGVLDTTSTLSGTFQNSGTELVIGSYNTQVDTYMNGYISNLRVSNSAVYTTAFTPSTQPLTSTANTQLLTCQSNRFIDNSTNNFTLTVNGNTTVNSFDPFIPNSSYSAYGSGYFDGTGDYLTTSGTYTFGTSSFTIEAWINTIAYPGSSWGVIFGNITTGSGNTQLMFNLNTSGNLVFMTWNQVIITSSVVVPLNSWSHVALTFDGTTHRIFLNGLLAGSSTASYNFSTAGAGNVGYAGAAGLNTFNGYVSNMRVVQGTAIYTANFTPPTSPLTAIENTSLLTLQNNQPVNNSTFLDNSTNNFLVTRAGNATQGTFSPYGGNWSNYFDGSGDYLSLASNAAFNQNTAFTVECWVNSSAGGYFFTQLNSGYLGLNYTADTRKIQVDKSFVGVQITSTNSFAFNQWHHVAMSYDGTTTRLFVNGTLEGSVAGGGSASGAELRIGNYNTGSNFYTGYISNLRISNSALYTSAFTPSTTPLTPTANTRLLTCADSRFVDDSINNFTITKGGDTSVQRFSPFNPSSITPTSYSGYFDGTGDYLTVPITTNATADLTFECWFYATGYGSLDYGTIIGAGVGTGIFQLQLYNASNPNRILGYVGSTSGVGNLSPTLSQPVLNRWIHLAVVRSGSTFTMYENGVSVATATNSNSMNFGTVTQLGAAGSSYTFQGYISNLRLVIGTAVYTSNFTPSTTPLTAIANTSLLTLQSTTFIDNSTNNFTITAAGNSQPSIQNPFGYTSATTNGYTVSTIGGSGYFDGTGDTLNLASSTALLGAGNFTVDFWVNLASAPTGGAYYTCFAYGASGSVLRCFVLDSSGTKLGIWVGASNVLLIATTAMIGQWAHIALTRVGSTLTAYINGVNAGTASNSTNFNAGQLYIASQAAGTYLPGYISDFRIVVGTSVYTSNFVPPSAPLTAVQNTVLLTNMTSAGIYNATMMTTMETVGDAKLSTAISKFGGSSMVFDGTGDYLSIPINPSLIFGTGDFTVETWVYLPSVSGYFGVVGMGSSGFFVQISNGNNIHVSQADVVDLADFAISPTLSANTWYHFAMTRSGTSMKAFINGIQQGSTVTNSTNFTGTNAVLVGGHPGGIILYSGYMDDLRITKGYARYTSNFTPPTSALQIK